MRVFLTGATGYIGSAVLDALLRARYEVVALVRDPRSGERLARKDVASVLGELARPAAWLEAAESAEVIVHTAFEKSKAGPDTDRQAIDAFLEAASRRGRTGAATTIVYTSGIWVLGPTQGQATEESVLRPIDLVAWRPAHEELVLAAAAPGIVRTVVIRPGIVYGGARGIVGDLLKDAQNGLVRIVGDGQNHWPCVYDRDLADLYARVATSGEAAGIYHATDEADERVSDIVAAIARQTRTPPDVRYMPLEEARAKMGAYADALALDQIVRSPRARALGWAPTLRSITGNVAGLLEEFRAARAA